MSDELREKIARELMSIEGRLYRWENATMDERDKELEKADRILVLFAPLEEKYNALLARFDRSEHEGMAWKERAEKAEAESLEARTIANEKIDEAICEKVHREEAEAQCAALREDAVRLRNCLRALTDGCGDGDGKLIEEGRRAVIETGYLDAATAPECCCVNAYTSSVCPIHAAAAEKEALHNAKEDAANMRFLKEKAEARCAKVCAALKEAATELLEVADLRGDSQLPLPEDSAKHWTARMQIAWNELRAALAAAEKE